MLSAGAGGGGTSAMTVDGKVCGTPLPTVSTAVGAVVTVNGGVELC